MGAEWIRRIEFIVILLIGAQMIFLIESHTYLPTTDQRGEANIETWSGGTLIYAHNYLDGNMFYDLTEATIIHNGQAAKYEVIETTIVTDPAQWAQALEQLSSPETITLATCYPPNGTGQMFLKELQIIEEP